MKTWDYVVDKQKKCSGTGPCGWQTRAAVNRRSLPQCGTGAIAGRFTDHAKRLDCGGFSTALLSDRGMVC
jgi:ribosomal protein S27AE